MDFLPKNNRFLDREIRASPQLSADFPCFVGPAGDSTLRAWAVQVPSLQRTAPSDRITAGQARTSIGSATVVTPPSRMVGASVPGHVATAMVRLWPHCFPR